ncbi:unnamed protein product [Sphagnum tenellum]
MPIGRLDDLSVPLSGDRPEDSDVHQVHRHPDVHSAPVDRVCGRRSGRRRRGNHSIDSRMALRRVFRGGQGNRILLHPVVRGASGIRCERCGLRQDGSSSRPSRRRRQESAPTILALGRSSCPSGHRGHRVRLHLPIREARDPSWIF